MKYLSFDVGIKKLAYCSLNNDKKILDWGIINLNKDPKCQCGIQKECSKTATYQINVPDNNEVKYCCTTHIKKHKGKKKKLNSNYDLFKISQIMMKELNTKVDFLNHEIICIENQPALKNPTMKSVQMLLYSYFIIEGVCKDPICENVQMINARNKLKVYKGPEVECKFTDKYKKNKYLAVEYTKVMILKEDKKFIDLFTESKKKDDLADAYLQGIYYIDK